jgi:enoyl-[acyl-carrier protein] reductase II
MKKAKICDLLGIEYPIIQAPMTWITSAEMVAAVSEAGGLGTLGPNAGAKTVTTSITENGERLRQQIKKVKSLTRKPFAVNLVIALPDYPKQGMEFSEECLRVIIEEKAPVVITVGGDAEVFTGRLKREGIKVLHRAVPINVGVAKASEKAGVDVIVAVGCDGGGHSGIDQIPTFSLIPQIVDAVKIPVIAGGGISDGRGLAAALAVGAEGAYLGTRFIASKECPAHSEAKQALIDATDIGTVTITGVFGILRSQRNALMERCLDMAAMGATPLDVATIYGGGFKTGLLDGDLIDGNLSWGAVVGMIKDIKSASDIIQDILKEADQALQRLC